tara:strand:- start:58 stop:1311 length:1254 start_codon:yes stop_codon:yes gene_type:complete
MTTLNLSTINLRINRETAIALQQNYINKNPDFQREYEAWNDKLKTRFVETMMIGRAMNPIWTILNPEDNSEEILDGMHRITTATDFLNNKFCINAKFLTSQEFEIYDKKCFKDLTPDHQQKIRNYNFIFNNLDSSYRTDLNKRRDMYEILNRSSKTLNDFEFNKVLYNPFFELITYCKDDLNKFFRKKGSRGDIETEIISLLVLSDKLPSSWDSIITLGNNFLIKKIGETEDSVNEYIVDNSATIKNKLDFFIKIIERLNYKNVFSESKKTFKKYYVPYKFFICRLNFKLQNIATFNRFIDRIIPIFKQQVLEVDILEKFQLNSRNAVFQKKLIELIDSIIDSVYDKSDPANKRLFSKKDILEKLKEQNNCCQMCNKNLLENNIPYEGDHIISWCNGGVTEYSNLQVLCKYCHSSKQ